jgi:hypothetical protein
MIYPQIGPQYLSEQDRGIVSKAEAFYSSAITICQQNWGEQDTDTRFYTGDQTLWNDLYGNLPANRRRQFTFNRIRRAVDMAEGHQRRNRKSTIAIPVKNASDVTADQITKLFLYHDREENVSETISEAFLGALVTGMNFLEVWMDYRNDPVNGEIKVDLVNYNDIVVDPYFRKHDFTDCSQLWRRKYLTKREVVSLFPDQEDEVLALSGNIARDGKFQYQPESYDYSPKNLLTYDTYYYKDFRTQKLLVDTNTGETTEWKSNDMAMLRHFLQQNEGVDVVESEIASYKVAIIVQGKVFYDGAQPTGLDCLPFVPVMAYYTPQSPYYPYRVEGMVRGLRDAQYLYNRRRIIELDILESQISSGWIYKENALVDPADIYNQAGQGKGLALKEEAQMTDVQKILAPDIPQGMFQLSEAMAKEIMEISGINEEMLGSANDDKAGILAMMRQGAGLTTLQKLYDQLDQSQKLLGSIRFQLMQLNWTPGHVKQIIGEDPTDFFYRKEFGKYDIAVEEGFNTTTQRQMQFAQMLQLKELGIPITNEDLIEAATLQNKKQLIENMQKQQEQQQQMAQQQMQVQMQEIQSRTELAKARALADTGLYEERHSRVEENRALAIAKLHEANKFDEQAALEKIKAIKELETIDLTHIEKLIAMIATLKSTEDIQSGEDRLKADMPEDKSRQEIPQQPQQQQQAQGQPMQPGI